MVNCQAQGLLCKLLGKAEEVQKVLFKSDQQRNWGGHGQGKAPHGKPWMIMVPHFVSWERKGGWEWTIQAQCWAWSTEPLEQVLLSSILLCPKEMEATFHILLQVIAPRAHSGRERMAGAGPRGHISVWFMCLKPRSNSQFIMNTVSEDLTLRVVAYTGYDRSLSRLLASPQACGCSWRPGLEPAARCLWGMDAKGLCPLCSL